MKKNFDNKTLGKLGESFVESYLNNKGYKTVGRNLFIGRGEIDLIVIKGSTYIFVEVKTRNIDKDFDIFETISYKKKMSLIRACESWLLINKKSNFPWRIDFAGVLIRNKNIVKIEYLENGIF